MLVMLQRQGHAHHMPHTLARLPETAQEEFFKSELLHRLHMFLTIETNTHMQATRTVRLQHLLQKRLEDLRQETQLAEYLLWDAHALGEDLRIEINIHMHLMYLVTQHLPAQTLDMDLRQETQLAVYLL